MAIKDFISKIRIFSTTEPEKNEFTPGLIIERRRFLWLPVIAAAALVAPKQLFAASNSKLLETAMTWDDFIKKCVPNAVELHKDRSAAGQDAYLYWIASMLKRVDLKNVPQAKLFKFGDINPPIEFGVGYKGVPFFAVEWRMAPNAILPPHCHPNGSVCTLGLEGETRIRNFEIVGNAPEFSSTQSFQVRETHNEIIAPGRINTLSATRDNIHTFQVGKEGARGIDISTYHGPDVGFSFLEIKDKSPIDENRIFEANWKKM